MKGKIVFDGHEWAKLTENFMNQKFDIISMIDNQDGLFFKISNGVSEFWVTPKDINLIKEEKIMKEENNKIMKFEDFQFGDIVTLRNGERYVFASGYLYGEDDTYYRDADCLTSDWDESNLNYEDRSEPKYDIVKIERNQKVIYEKIAREMTIKEISEALGYEVKVVKEKE